MDDIEFNLTQHPLALFPHLEESLLPDVSCVTSHYFTTAVFFFYSEFVLLHQLIIFSFNPKLFFYFLLKVFEDVVEILDPEMNIDSETGEDIIPVRH